MTRFGIIFLMFAVLVLSACSEQPVVLKGEATAISDFSGSWELDYQRSDRVNERVRGLYHEIQRIRERQANSAEIGAGSNQRARMGLGSVEQLSAEGVIDLARLAELITRGQLLEIEQFEDEITIGREDTFNLNCVFAEGDADAIIDSLGAEVCGWDAHQLVFKIFLPDGLNIVHRLSLAPDKELLNIATTLSSRHARYPFTLNRVYQKFDKLNDGISCKQTLTKGRVCTTESS